MWNKLTPQRRKKLKRLAVIVLLIAAALYGFCLFLSYKAADIFNIVVAERQLFPGTVTVERLTATPGGSVSFENLLWQDEEGETLAQIPEGSFRVKLSDILTRHIGTQSLEDVTLEEPYIHLIFNDKMELQHMKKAKDGSGSRPDDLISITGPKSNRPFNCRVTLHHAVIEAESPQRHFKIGDVEFTSHVHTKGKTDIDLRAGHFTGTVEAGALRIRGSLDFKPDVPQYNLSLLLSDCNPRSLGAGLDVDDPATVSADIRGPLAAPVIDGTLKMDKLDITALVFTDIVGQVHYEKGILDVQDVTAKVFGGSMEGRGSVNLDERAYTADMIGKDLKGGIAAHDLFMKCNVDLKLHMDENKTAGTKHIYGDFHSGPGRYHSLPFRGISGSFAQDGKTLTFRDVVISMFFGDVSTDAFTIVNGKVHLGPINIDYKNGGHSQWKR